MVVLSHNLLLEMIIAREEAVTATMVNRFLNQKQFTQI